MKAFLAKAKKAIGDFLTSLKKPATVKKFLTYVAGIVGALVANGALSGQALVIANTIVAVLTGAGIYSFSNAQAAP